MAIEQIKSMTTYGQTCLWILQSKVHNIFHPGFLCIDFYLRVKEVAWYLQFQKIYRSFLYAVAMMANNLLEGF